jgi:hypothetical protein
MLFLKLLEQVRLFLIIARRQPLLFLSLVEHHLLHHRSRFAVQITQFAVLWLNLRSVNLRRRGHDVGPPLHLVDFVEVDANLLTGRGRLKRPGGFVDIDGFG